jgi:hypothetical protein
MRMLKLSLTQDELSALLNLCLKELRTPTDQIRFILREDLHRRGLLEPHNHPPSGEDQSGDLKIAAGQ